MPFQQFKLDRSVQQTRGIFDKYVYSPDNGDTIADILQAGYFDDSRFVNDPDWVGSLIEIEADEYFLGRVQSDNSVVSVIPNISSTSLGWEFIIDTEYPNEANGLDISADTWTRIPNDGTQIPQATDLPVGVTSFYDEINDKLDFDELDAWFDINILFAVVPLTSNANIQVRGLIDASPSPLPFYGPTVFPLVVDSGEANVLVVASKTPTTQNVFHNGVYYEVNCSSDCVLYQSAYLISKQVQK
ncbi:MAG: hypothetical protein CMI54_04585 [Parcubacteria group bacterium]|nr:hypothetical protein [Parcubacteria group bacterium]